MKILLLSLIIIMSSCVSNEGGINISTAPVQEASPNDNPDGSAGNSPDGSSENNSSSSITLIDFEDQTSYATHFDLSYNDGSYFTANFNVANSLLGSNTVECVTSLNTRIVGGCIHTTKNTYNLPITVEFEFHAPDPYWTGTKVGISFFQDDGSQGLDTAYGVVTSGNNALGFYWFDSYIDSLGIPYYSRFIEGYGQLSGIDPRDDVSLGDQGKMKIDIDATGNWQVTFTKYDTNKSIVGTLTHTGTLSTLPTNFKIQIYQSSYSNTSRSDGGDTILSAPYNHGQYTYIDNISIDE